MSISLNNNYGSGYDLSEIQALNLRSLRNSDLNLSESGVMTYVAIPIFGWIALAYKKISNMIHHGYGEKMLERWNFEKADSDEKITILSKAIKVSGNLAWQYHLESARLHILKEDFKSAAADLQAVRDLRGSPWQTGYNNVKGKGLVFFNKDTSSHWVDSGNVMHVEYHNAPEALLNAVVLSSNQKFVDAYNAYNEVIFYDHFISHSRRHQSAIVAEMRKNPESVDGNGAKILAAENSLSKLISSEAPQ
jgi:hypothetical protein